MNTVNKTTELKIIINNIKKIILAKFPYYLINFTQNKEFYINSNCAYENNSQTVVILLYYQTRKNILIQNVIKLVS